MRLRTWLPLVMLGFVAACTDGPTEPEAAGLTGADPYSPAGPAITQPAAPTAVAHFSLTSNGDGVGPTVTTDKEDYQPGDTVTISGSGWLAGETVELVIEEDTPGADLLVFSSVADDNGDFVNRDLLIEERHLGVTFTLTATGLTSGLTAGTGFTDGNVSAVTLFEIRESTCTTAQASFASGATVCAYVTFTVAGSGPTSFSIRWFSGGSQLRSTTFTGNPLTSPKSDTYVPAAGSWDVKVCSNTGGTCNQIGSTQSFTITAPPANTAPELGAIGNKSLAWGNLLTFTATATDADLPPQTLTFSLDAGAPAGASIVETTGVFTWTPTNAQIGTYNITVRVTDNGTPTMSDFETISVTVNKRATQLVYGGSTDGQYSDKATLSATLTDNGGGTLQGNAISSKTVNFTLGTQGPTGAATNGSGVASLDLTLTQPAGSYTVTSSFVEDAHYLASSDSDPFTIYAEDATVTADASNPDAKQVATPGGNSGPFSLVFAVQETYPEPDANDGALPGQIDNAGLSVTLVPVGYGGPVSPVSSCSTSITGAGYAAIKTFTCDFNNVPVNTYEVEANVTGGYYTGSTVEALTIYDPSLGFITGGGTFYLGGERVTFGFTMKYNKKGTNPQGSLLVIRHTPTGKYRAKSNQVSALAIATDGSATFSGKATYVEPGWLTTVGNQSFTVYVKDVGEPGVGRDKFWVSVGGNTAGLKMAAPATSNAVTLTGGNIQVPHK